MFPPAAIENEWRIVRGERKPDVDLAFFPPDAVAGAAATTPVDELIVRAAIGDEASRQVLIDRNEDWIASSFSTWDSIRVYEELGWSIVPQLPHKKAPHIPWKPYQTERPDHATLSQWFEIDHPDAGPAVILGPVSGLCATDVDGKEAHEALIEHLGEIPLAPMAISGSGSPFRYHLFFKHPDFPTKARATPWHEKLEFRGNKGILVLSPALHKSGNSYAWVKGHTPWDLEPPPLPAAVYEAWAVVRHTPRRPIPFEMASSDERRNQSLVLGLFSVATQEFIAGLHANGSSWNSRLYAAACDLAGNGCSHEQAIDLLRQGAKPWNREEEENMLRTIESAYSEPRLPARQLHAITDTGGLSGAALLPAEVQIINIGSADEHLSKPTAEASIVDSGALSDVLVMNLEQIEQIDRPRGLQIIAKPASRGRKLISVFFDDKPLHADTFDPINAKSRERFIEEILNRMGDKASESTRQEIESALLGFVQASLAEIGTTDGKIDYRAINNPDDAETWGMYSVVGQTSRQITNFVAIVDRDISFEDDLEPTRRFEGHVELPRGRYEFTVDAKDFGKDQELRATLYNSAGTDIQFFGPLNDVRNAISTVSQPQSTRVTTNFGWNAEGSEYRFPAGRITRGGFQVASEHDPLRVDLSVEERARRLNLSQPTLGISALKRHVVEDLLQLHLRPVMSCLLGSVGLAILQRFVEGRNKPAIWLSGITGSGKSFAAKLIQNFFGQFPLAHGEFVNWNSTANYVERQGYFFRDAVFLVDDYKPEVTRQGDVLRVLQAYADATSRGRLNAESRTRRSREIRGLLVSTGEDVPEHNPSSLARMIVIQVPQKEKDVERGRRCVQEARHYPEFTAAFIHHLIVEGRIPQFIRRVDELTDYYYQGISGQQNDIRIAGNFAQLATAFGEIAAFLGDVWPEAAEEIRRFQEEDLIKIRDNMLENVQAEQPSNVLLSTLGELIMNGQVQIQGLTVPGQYGQRVENKSLIGKSVSRSGRNHHLGPFGDGIVEISMKMAIAEVNKFLAQSGRPTLAATEQNILSQLRQDGLLLNRSNERLSPNDREDTTRQTRIQGGRQRVFRIRVRDLIGEERADEENSERAAHRLLPTYPRESQPIPHQGTASLA